MYFFYWLDRDLRSRAAIDASWSEPIRTSDRGGR
jgi:hypothetical protein